MIYVTGDTHGVIDYDKLLSPELRKLSKDDYVIICGDCGVFFFPDEKEEMLQKYSSLPYTILFIDGNHENFDMLNEYPVEEWNGGKIHRLSEQLIHLLRGQVFTIEGHTFFTFGGGLSVDKAWRTPRVSWWPEELPTDEEIEEGMNNLKQYDYQVDFVLTHDCPITIGKIVCLHTFKSKNGNVRLSKSNEALEQFYNVLKFKHWYFGHYHFDLELTEQFTCLYQDFIRVV